MEIKPQLVLIWQPQMEVWEPIAAFETEDEASAFIENQCKYNFICKAIPITFYRKGDFWKFGEY